MCARLAAQDVTVLPVDWLGSQERLDELPVLKGLIEPKFPEELKKTTQIGWAEVEMYVDEKGMVHGKNVYGSLPRYLEAANASYEKVTFAPAVHNGTPTAVRVRQVFLFNPASAAIEGPEATPRLLKAEIIVDPARKVTKEVLRAEPEVVWVTATIDSSGRAVEVMAPSRRLTELIREKMKDWRFAPARRGGSPENTTINLPVILSAPGGLRERVFVPARAITQVQPRYPLEALRVRAPGMVLLDLVVDTEGKVREVKVRRASADVFAAAATEAVRQWRFAPALNDGTPVQTRIRLPVRFALTLDDKAKDDAVGGGKGVTVKEKGDPSKLPEHLRFDTPPKVWTLEQPVYPYAHLAKSTKGSAQVAVVVGPDGKVAAAKVVQASSPEFGFALLAAVEQFQYEPAIKDGDPTATMVRVEQKFEPKGGVENLIVSDDDRAALGLEQKNPEKIAKSSELDASLKPIHTPAPAYPRSLEEAVDGEAVVEFLVNDHGHPALSRIVSASRPEFGYAAVHGIADWVFEVPKRNGQPVTVRVRVPVKFRPPPGYPNEQRVLVP
jgi:TonB family protein